MDHRGDFAALYSGLVGRRSVDRARDAAMLLRSMLLQALGASLMERLDFDVLFRWFVGLSVDDSVFTRLFFKNRGRLLDGEIVRKFLSAVLTQPRVKRLLSGDHSRWMAR